MTDSNLIESGKKSNSGRRIHQYWAEGYFEPFYYDDNNGKKKIAALCKLCNNVLKNTSIQRLQIHRKSCYSNAVKLPQPEWKLSDENFAIVIDDSNSSEPITMKIEASDYKIEEKKIKVDSTFENQSKIEEPSSSSLPLIFNIGSCTSLYPKNENDITIRESSSTVLKKSINSTNNNKKNLDYMLAKFFFACNIPFKEIESSAFHEFINELNQKYKIPDKEKLSTILLNEIYDDAVKKQAQKVKNESVLLINFLRNQQAHYKIFAFLYLPEEGKKIFLNLVECSIEIDFKEVFKNFNTYAQEKFKTEIYAIVTNEKSDSDDKSYEIYSTLEINKFMTDKLFYTQCNLQISNGIIGSLIDDTLAANVFSILKDFKQPQNERLLLAYGAPKIILPKNTASYLDAFKYILDYLTILKQIPSLANSNEDNKGPSIDPAHIRLLQKPDFLINITYHIKNLTTLFGLIQKFKTLNFSIADAVQEWVLLKLTNASILANVRKKALQKYSILANILHPNYRGEQLTNEEKNLGEEFLFSYLNADGLESYQNYCTRKDVFESLLEKTNLSWQTFWSLANRKHPILSDLAQHLLLIPAVAEHEFDFDEIHNNNNLKEDCFNKFLHVRYALKNQDI